MDYFLLSFMFLPVLLLGSQFYCKILPQRKHFPHPFTSCCLFYAVFIIPAAYLRYSYPLYGTWFIRLIIIFPSLFFFGGKLIMRIMAVLLVLTLACIAEIAFVIPARVLNLFIPELNIHPVLLLHDGHYGLYCFSLLLYIGLQALCFCALGNLIERHRGIFTPKIILQLDFPILFTLVLSDSLAVLGLSSQTPLYKFVLLISIYILLYGLCFLMLHSGLNTMLHLEKRQIIQEEQKRLLEQQLNGPAVMNDAYVSIRKWNHDYTGHLLSLSYLINQRKYKEASQYITDIKSKKIPGCLEDNQS